MTSTKEQSHTLASVLALRAVVSLAASYAYASGKHVGEWHTRYYHQVGPCSIIC